MFKKKKHNVFFDRQQHRKEESVIKRKTGGMDRTCPSLLCANVLDLLSVYEAINVFLIAVIIFYVHFV